MKELIKKLNNMKLSSLIVSIAAVFGAVVVLLSLIFYQKGTINIAMFDEYVAKYASYKASIDAGVAATEPARDYYFVAFYAQPILGMVYYISTILAVILGVVVVYRSFPYILNKTKMEPVRFPGYLLLAENVFILVDIVLTFILLATTGADGTYSLNYAEIWCILVAFESLSVVFSGLWMYPTLKCNFYCPLIETKELERR